MVFCGCCFVQGNFFLCVCGMLFGVVIIDIDCAVAGGVIAVPTDNFKLFFFVPIPSFAVLLFNPTVCHCI